MKYEKLEKYQCLKEELDVENKSQNNSSDDWSIWNCDPNPKK